MEGTGGAGRTAVAASGSAEDFEEQHIELRHLSTAAAAREPDKWPRTRLFQN